MALERIDPKGNFKQAFTTTTKEGEPMRTKRSGISRRDVLKLGAAAAASAALPLVHVRTARAAGKLSVGFWDHWVPAGNAAMKKQVEAWAKKNKVEVTADFITSVGNKNLLTICRRGPGQDRPRFSWPSRPGMSATTRITLSRWMT